MSVAIYLHFHINGVCAAVEMQLRIWEEHLDAATMGILSHGEWLIGLNFPVGGAI
jgi:hypothetical protein